MEQIVVLDVIDEGLLRNTTQRVLVHIPGDPNGAWSVFKSLRYLANGLGRRLRSTHYQSFFSRFVRRRDSQRFFSVVIPAYADLAIWANITLDEAMHPYPAPLFDALAGARIRQIKDDAAMIAVPVIAVDREIQRRHDERLAAEGWALLSLAGFFVPVIGAALLAVAAWQLLAVAAWQLLGEVFHGIETWHDGDTHEALDHLFNVAIDLAVIGAGVVGARAASRLWTRSAAVDALVPARLEDGTCKLWNADLTAFRSEAPAPEAIADRLGVHSLGDQSWIEMDGHHFAVIQRAADGQWQLRPRHGYGPLLSHNGFGAWRLWCEQPAQWDDLHRMFRRLGGPLRELDNEQIDQILSIHGLDADYLRGMHVYALAPDAELLDSAMRIKLVRRIRALTSALRAGEPVEDMRLLQNTRVMLGAAGMSDADLSERIWAQRRQLFQRVYENMQNSDGPGVAALRRSFPSLHEPGASELLRTASFADRQQLLETARVPLGLAEAARDSALRIRTARVYEAFLVDTGQNADLARVALSMLKYLPAAATGSRWRLFEGYGDGPLLFSTNQGAQAFGLIHQNGTFRLLNAQGAAIGESGDLFDVMAAAYGDIQRDAMGISAPFAAGLRTLIGRQAIQRRQEVRTLLNNRAGVANGWFRAPLRQADGRIGYPLSGRRPANSSRRSAPRSLFAMVRELYPIFTDAQIEMWIADMHDSGALVEPEIIRLGQQLDTLRVHLHRWQSQARTPAEQRERQAMSRAVLDCWQRRAHIGSHPVGQAMNYRFTLVGLTTRTLPDLPQSVSFAHVHQLAMLGMELHTLPDGFLQVFTNLRVLELSGNRLTRLPPALMQLRHLRELDLFNNRVILDAAQATILASCESLQYINLSFNPLGRTFSLSGLSRLRRLHMRHTGIRELPNALLNCPDLLVADLRENQITRLPNDFYRAPPWLRRFILLADNPLSGEETQRLVETMTEDGASLGYGTAGGTSMTSRQQWLDAAHSVRRDELSLCWEALAKASGTGEFFDMTRRLLDTADFRQGSQALANRVFTMISAMNEHASLRQELLDQLTQNLTCQDSVTLCFSNLELRMLVWQAQFTSARPQDALLYLGRQLWRLDEVDRIALADIRARRASGADPDEIEVGLAWRLALRDALDLPAQPGDMLFRDVAGLEPQVIARAQARIEAAETAEHVAASLVTREFWQEHLLRIERSRLDAIDAPFHDRLALLMDAHTVLDGERVAQMNRIRDERLEAQHALMRELTLEALQTTPRPSGTAPH